MTRGSGGAPERDRRESVHGDAEEVADLLSEIGRTFKARLRTLPDSPAHALSMPQRDVLVRIGRRPGSTPAGISERTGRDRGQVTRLVAELEGLGLVEKQRSLEDRRSVSIALSEAGDALFARMLKRRAELSDTMIGHLSSDERLALRDMLVRMRDSLKEMPSGEPPALVDRGGP